MNYWCCEDCAIEERTRAHAERERRLAEIRENSFAAVLDGLERLAKILSTEAALHLSIAAEEIKKARQCGRGEK